jgi:hypothetical protein
MTLPLCRPTWNELTVSLKHVVIAMDAQVKDPDKPVLIALVLGAGRGAVADPEIVQFTEPKDPA